MPSAILNVNTIQTHKRLKRTLIIMGQAHNLQMFGEIFKHWTRKQKISQNK